MGKQTLKTMIINGEKIEIRKQNLSIMAFDKRGDMLYHGSTINFQKWLKKFRTGNFSIIEKNKPDKEVSSPVKRSGTNKRFRLLKNK
jgi:hypothetical protein